MLQPKYSLNDSFVDKQGYGFLEACQPLLMLFHFLKRRFLGVFPVFVCVTLIIMLTENDVVQKVTDYLGSKDYKIINSLNTYERGIDIVAENDTAVVYIEAKGETSSKKTSNRFGKPFSKGQIRSHISVALFATMKVIADMPAGDKTKVGIALPDTPGHRDRIYLISQALTKFDIRIYWVSPHGVVVE